MRGTTTVARLWKFGQDDFILTYYGGIPLRAQE